MSQCSNKQSIITLSFTKTKNIAPMSAAKKLTQTKLFFNKLRLFQLQTQCIIIKATTNNTGAATITSNIHDSTLNVEKKKWPFKVSTALSI